MSSFRFFTSIADFVNQGIVSVSCSTRLRELVFPAHIDWLFSSDRASIIDADLLTHFSKLEVCE